MSCISAPRWPTAVGDDCQRAVLDHTPAFHESGFALFVIDVVDAVREAWNERHGDLLAISVVGGSIVTPSPRGEFSFNIVR
jgi:hypothetical protein